MKTFMNTTVRAYARRISLRSSMAGLLLGALLSINAYAQPQGATPSGAPPQPPPQTGYYIKLKVKPGKGPELEKAVGKMMIGVRTKEPKNVYCDLFHDPDDRTTYVILERYRDIPSSKEHGDSAYIKELGETLKSLLDAPPVIEPLVYMRSK